MDNKELLKYGITITEAYKDLSQHYIGQISVWVHAKGIFKGCKKIRDISQSWDRDNGTTRLSALFSHNGECYIPKDVLAQWIKDLPVKYESYNIDKLTEQELTAGIAIAKNCDTWTDILNLDGSPYESKLFSEVK